MLKDVRLSGMIIRGCPEKNREDVVHILRIHVQPLSTCSLVSQLERLDVEVRDLLNCSDFEAFDLLANLDVVRDAILASRDVVAELVSFSSGCHYFSRCGLLLLHLRQ